MATKLIACCCCCFLFLSHLLPSVLSSPQPLHINTLSNALSQKGYVAMSLTLDLTLRTLLSSLPSSSSSSSSNTTTTTFTIFCPLDKAFYSSKYPQPPLTLLQYHISPLKLERQTLQSSSSYPVGSKIDTLLPGHPLVVSTLHKRTREVSINDVKITDWEIYNDGRIILHGVENFFDPAFQTLLYPLQYDGQDNGIRSATDKIKGLATL